LAPRKRAASHNRFAADLDTEPAQLHEALWGRRQEQQEQYTVGWRRNLCFIALVVVVALAAMPPLPVPEVALDLLSSSLNVSSIWFWAGVDIATTSKDVAQPPSFRTQDLDALATG
jgi:hypothetical protein